MLCVGNWKDRTQIVNYCVDVVEKTMDDRRRSVEGTESNLDAEPQVRAKLYSDEVLVSVGTAWFSGPRR